MKFSQVLSSILFSSFVSIALAGPVPNEDVGLHGASHDFADLEARAAKNIPTEQEVSELLQVDGYKKFSKFANPGMPAKDTSVFFTGQDGRTCNKIVEWATKTAKLTSIRQIWKSPNLSTRGQYKWMESNDEFASFQKAFSKYFASASEGTAWLLFPHSSKPSSNRVFYSTELPRLIAAGKVTKIVWIDQEKVLPTSPKYDAEYSSKGWQDETKLYWKTGDKAPAAGDAAADDDVDLSECAAILGA